jgi:manganese oxidase
MGMIVVHPKVARKRVDRDFVLMTSEWTVKPGERRPNPLAMNDFNMLTFNSKSFPLTDPLVVKTGEHVRIRLGNLGAMDHHPIHFHGLYFKVTGTDGGPIPEAGQWPETTVLVPVGTTRDIEFVPTEPGDWAMHCHMTHHVMTQMGHDSPNMVGARSRALDTKMRKLVPGYMSMGQTGMGNMAEMEMPVPANSAPMRGGPGPFSYIDMGGMFTILKVRDKLDSYADPGWYKHPEGKVSDLATASDMAADGVDPNA